MSTERLTTYDQILDAAVLLTSKIESYRKMWSPNGTFGASIRLYNRALNRFIEFMSTVEIQISEIKGFRRFFIYPNEHMEIPYYTVYVRRKYATDQIGRENNNYDRANNNDISFEYYSKARIRSYKPSLYDILFYIKELYYIDIDLDLVHPPIPSSWSHDKIKEKYPEFKESLETSEKIHSIFSGADMLTIPITLGCPHYDDYYEEIFRLEEIEKADSDANETPFRCP